MSQGEKVPLQDAEQVARDFMALVGPVCQRVELAGSVRRRKPLVGDIEIVAQPSWQGTVDLFGQETGPMLDLLDARMNELRTGGLVEARTREDGKLAWGTKYKGLLYRGFKVDLFSVTGTAQWGVIYFLRTGPHDWNKRMVTQLSKGGWCPEYLRFLEGEIVHSDTREAFQTPEEEDVFRVLGYEWVPPEARNGVRRPRRLAVRT